jgi:hypothetical protein
MIKIGKERNKAVIRIFLNLLFLLAGCEFDPDTPYEPLSKLRDSDQAVARIYAAPFSPLGRLAVHTWIILKASNATEFDRWEGWTWYEEPYGYLRKNLYGPEDDFGFGSCFIVSEIIGPEAQKVDDFVTNHYQEYPYIDEYDLLPGPNCNTFTAWVIESTGWSAELPDAAYGKYYYEKHGSEVAEHP